jgi:hypothetical protein
MKKTEILDTENCLELIYGLCLRVRECEAEIDKAQDEDTRQKWFDTMESVKELKRAINDLVDRREIRRYRVEARRWVEEHAKRAHEHRRAAMDRISQLDEELGLT